MFSWISKPIGHLLGIGENLSKPEQYRIKKEKRYLYRLESAMKYVFATEKSGEYSRIDGEKQKSLQEHHRKRIFDIG